MSEDTFRMGADFEPQEAVVVGWPRLIEPVKGVFAEGTVHEIVRNLIGHVDKIIINCGWPGSAARCRILGLETNVTPCYLRKNSIKTKKEMNVTLYFRILHAILCLRDWRGDLKSSIALCQNF